MRRRWARLAAVKVGVGKPVTVAANEPAVLGTNVVLLVLVNTGLWLTMRVKFWVAFGAVPLLAVKDKV